MKTGSWATIGAAPGRIGISLGSPRGQPAGYKLYKPLAPTREMLNMSLADYRPRYEAILAALDPQKAWDDIHKLAFAATGIVDVEPIILCFEKPPFTASNFCHRRMAADWFERELGVVVPEYGFEQPALV